jgi:hypothetical protein
MAHLFGIDKDGTDHGDEDSERNGEFGLFFYLCLLANHIPELLRHSSEDGRRSSMDLDNDG